MLANITRSRTERRTFEFLERRDLLAADVYISEILASNRATLSDDFGEFSDWLELYNAGPDDLTLEAWHLTDDPANLTKWSFPAQEFSAGNFLLVYLSDRDRSVVGSPLHANFKIKSSGEYLALSKSEGDSVAVVSEFAPAFPMQRTDVSYGFEQVVTDAGVHRGELTYFRDPTPQALNSSTGIHGFLLDNDVRLSQPRGFYEDGFSLTMSSTTDGTTIRYTLDGSEPSVAHGFEYTAPIVVDSTTTVRARSFKDGFRPSRVETATYLFLNDVIEQSRDDPPPTGFPAATQINGQSLVYGMRSSIVESETWGPHLIDALTQIPSMSLVIDAEDLLGSESGIYTNAQNRGRAWERPASLELINADGSEGFQVDMGVRIRGGTSRRGSNPKHAFRFFFRDEYGDATLNYPLFGDEGATQFKKVDLRTSQNYSWAGEGSEANTFLRDVFSRDIQREMGQPYTRSRFYHLYINGHYWGLFQTQERAEAWFAETYLGGDRDDYDVVKASLVDRLTNEATDGTLDAYRRLADLFYQPDGLSDSNIVDYWRAQGMNPDGTLNPVFERLLDVDNLIDYTIMTYYTGDRDGPVSQFLFGVNNYFAVFNRESPDGFKFFDMDSEHTLDVGFANLPSLSTVHQISGRAAGEDFEQFNPLWMHEQLIAGNSEYRLRFADAAQKHLTNRGILTAANATALFDSRAAEIDQAIIAESARWGRGTSSHTKTTWQTAVDRARRFVAGRSEQVTQQFRDLGWYPATNAPMLRVDGNAQLSGDITADSKIQLTESASIDFPFVIVDEMSPWRYLDDGSDQSSAWRGDGFNDLFWKTGQSELGYGDFDEFTEIDFGPDPNNKHITTYFRKAVGVADPSDFDLMRLRTKLDDGGVVYLNGQEIFRTNLPDGEINYQTRAIEEIEGEAENAFHELDLDPSLFRGGANTLAAEVHQASGDSPDASFVLELLGGRFNTTDTNVYYTLDGTDPRLPGGGISPEAVRFHHPFSLTASATIIARTVVEGDWSVATVAEFAVPSADLFGDFNLDRAINELDIDLLAAAIHEAAPDPRFDLDDDGSVDEGDLTLHIESILGTRRGDANLDGKVDFTDFLTIAASFGNEDVGWSDGSFDTNSIVDFGDFLLLADNFGFDRLIV